jgi:hypothetical protein
MTDKFPPTKQRPALLAFAEALDSRASALRRDECGDWAIFGRNGHIYAVPEGFQLMVGCDTVDSGFSKSGWSWAKKRLKFARITQDGDGEGSVILGRLPAQAEAVEIRDILGIPKRKHLSEEHLAILMAHGFARVGNGDLPASNTSDATLVKAVLA